MLLRRVIEHVKTQNWFAVVLDFVIVVFGVFIGIQVSNWNDGQADKRAFVDALERLRAEMAANISTMDIVDEEVGSTLELVQAGADALVSCRDDPATLRVVNEGVKNLVGTAGLRLRRSTLDELTSDPRLLSQQSTALRSRLADVLFYHSLAADEARFYEYFPLESRPELNPIIAVGPRQQVKQTYFGIDYSKNKQDYELGVPVSVACQDQSLAKAFKHWEGWQSNLPIMIQKMRDEYRLTQELLDAEAR